jgi:trimeric autotransporter adhesin
MPANTGLGNVTSETDVNVFAVNMPNVSSPGTNDWTAFKTTVNDIQRSTGYDFLSSLPEAIQCRIEVRNCAPRDVAFSGATILAGETYAATGSFTDPDADSWSGTVDYGDGATESLSISGKSFQLSHRYTSAGSLTVTVSVSDQRGGTSSGTAVVTVESASDGVAHLSGLLAGLPGDLNSLQSKLDNAGKQLSNGKSAPAANMLEAFVNELQAMINSGRVSDAQCAPIIAYAQRVIASARS